MHKNIWGKSFSQLILTYNQILNMCFHKNQKVLKHYGGKTLFLYEFRSLVKTQPENIFW